MAQGCNLYPAEPSPPGPRSCVQQETIQEAAGQGCSLGASAKCILNGSKVYLYALNRLHKYTYIDGRTFVMQIASDFMGYCSYKLRGNHQTSFGCSMMSLRDWWITEGRTKKDTV